MENVSKQIGNLAEAVANGFASVEKRFDKVDDRFEKVENHLARVEHRLDDLDADVRQLHSGMLGLRADIRDLQKTSIPMDEYQSLLRRLSIIEEKLGIANA